MTENESFIYESIYNHVRTGFLPIDDIKEYVLEEIEDNEFSNEISEAWANETIEKEVAQLKKESQTWSKPTDTDKLIQAFDQLCKENIIALHNAGFTSSDGHYECVEVESALREAGKQSDGYCFYHEQDLARAIVLKEPSLMIAFQKVNNSDDAVTIQVGNCLLYTSPSPRD